MGRRSRPPEGRGLRIRDPPAHAAERGDTLNRALVLGSILSCITTSATLALAADAPPGTSLRSRFAPEVSEALLASDSTADRLRGLERLGSAGTPRAIVQLTQALEPGGTSTTSEERLTAVRQLAAFTADPTVRRVLARVAGGHAAPEGTFAMDPLDVLAEETAAVALARAGTADALSTLGRALATPGRSARTASNAILAYPPVDLSLLLRATAMPSLELVSTLEGLSDQRSLERLRTLVVRAPLEVRARAAVALTRLGDFETVEVARSWTKTGPSVLRIAAAEILSLAHDAGAPRAIRALIDDDGASGAGIELALAAPDAFLVPSLERRLGDADGPREAAVVAAIGRAGGPRAPQVLERMLSHPSRGALAAHSLARMAGDGARAVLSRALTSPSTKRLAVRAATFRYLVLGDVIDRFEEALAALGRSRDASDRAAAAAGLAALHPGRIADLVSSDDQAVAEGALPLLLLASKETRQELAARLATTKAPSLRAALALSLTADGAADSLPTSALSTLVEGGGVEAPLGVRALCERDDPRLRPRIEALLASGDPVFRSHAALGLGKSPRADATGLLSAAYRFETDARVRAAIVRALSERSDDSGRRVLLVARDVDPDRRVRALARLAVQGAHLDHADAGSTTVWVPIFESGGKPVPPFTLSTILTEDGLSLPVGCGADGILLAAGLPDGLIDVRVAPGWGTVNDPP